MNLEDSLQQVRAEFMDRMRRGSGHLLLEVETFVTSRTGKMLRPRFTLLAADTLGQASSRRTILLATAVEMLHNASLLHDDIIDRADTRRGQPSVNARWGNATAVLVGDYLLAQVMHLLDEADDRVATRLVNRTVIEMVESELLQQKALKQSSDQVIKQYLAIIDGKTARLFATACAIGNPLYEDFGLHYGRLFQMRDDIADGEAPDFVNQLIEQETQELNNLQYKLSI